MTAPSIHYAVDPYWPDGSVIPHVSADPVGAVGTADKRIEVYDFRLCFTDSPSHRIPFWKPAGYNASEWEFWRRIYVQSGPPDNLKDAGLSCIGQKKRAVIFFGWVFFLISLGGQAPHVLRDHMWAFNTCGEPNEIELTAAHG